jgi:4,5-DOPA dioxygenase extradiol
MMPTLFIGHGSPMNSIEENEFTQGWEEIASTIPKPKSIVSVSAHWFVPSTLVTTVKAPRTIRDFYGFPPELYKQQYPAPGAPELAAEISKSLIEYSIGLDFTWGLDHGTWSVLKKMYPEADVPIVQLSIDYTKGPRYHFELGKKLDFLRDRGTLIVGSGNLVHNLRAVIWNSEDSTYEWAQKFEDVITDSILSNDISSFVDFENIKELARKAHPSLDHYLPLLYAVGAGGLQEIPVVYNQKIVHGSISMTCFKFN